MIVATIFLGLLFTTFIVVTLKSWSTPSGLASIITITGSYFAGSYIIKTLDGPAWGIVFYVAPSLLVIIILFGFKIYRNL